jgi:hypothetical protein
MLEKKLADADVSVEEQHNILKDLEKKETEYMRLRRHKMGVDDFELLTIIGRGAFGEVMHQFIHCEHILVWYMQNSFLFLTEILVHPTLLLLTSGLY